MQSIVNYAYDKDCLKKISDWPFGRNWPSVYIIYSSNGDRVRSAYVGETLDACRRTKEHLEEKDFAGYTNICLISDLSFNKSVILDLEAFLIKYMSASEIKLKNGNAGIDEHQYFYKEAYENEFKDIWDSLIQYGIVQKSITDLENSELYKYSPYKTLNQEQLDAAYKILKSLNETNNASIQSIIRVCGGAGTGKTILAVYLLKLLSDLADGKNAWKTVEDTETAHFLLKRGKELSSIRKIGFVVPMKELNQKMKKLFRTIDGLSPSMVLTPKQVANQGIYYDVLFVDEAHRLYRWKNIPGQESKSAFKKTNQKLMGKAFTGTEKDWTELDWIIKSSRIQVLFYDELQAIRTADIGKERFEEICKPHLAHSIELFSQMRCKGGNGYYEYIRDVLSKPGMNLNDYRRIDNYELKVFDHISELFSWVDEKKQSEGKDGKNLCAVIGGPGWSLKQDIVIEGISYHWFGTPGDNGTKSIKSIHKIQGFDLKYAGVIFGKEIVYDKTKQKISIVKSEVGDRFTKGSSDAEMERLIINTYITLMTRGIMGTCVYAVDEDLREYLKLFLR